ETATSFHGGRLYQKPLHGARPSLPANEPQASKSFALRAHADKDVRALVGASVATAMVAAASQSVARHTYDVSTFRVSSRTMSILIAEDNVAQRAYLREILERDFPSHHPVHE